MKRLLGLGAACIALCVTATACGSGIGGSYAAKVNGDVIKTSDLNEELRQIRDNKEYADAFAQNGTTVAGKGGKDTFDSGFVAQLASQEVLFALVHQELGRRHLEVTQADLDQTRADLEQSLTNQQGKSLLKPFSKWYQDRIIRQRAEVGVLQKALGNPPTDDAAVQRYYDANKQQFTETCVRHILVDSAAKADAVRAQLVGGADFATVAKAQSTDTASAQQGGDLGCDISGFVPEFQQAASTLPVNQISQPVKSQFGYHIIEVTKRDTKPLDDDLKAQIRQALEQGGSQQISDLVFGLMDKAKVAVNPSIGTFHRGNVAKGDQSAIVPNAAPKDSSTSTTEPTANTAP